jgi:ABC-type Mn2+/Zn2+ transport system permease subunit
MMATACLLGVASIFIGLIITYHFDTAAGATMAGTAVAIFFIVLAGRELVSRIGWRAHPAHA